MLIFEMAENYMQTYCGTHILLRIKNSLSRYEKDFERTLFNNLKRDIMIYHKNTYMYHVVSVAYEKRKKVKLINFVQLYQYNFIYNILHSLYLLNMDTIDNGMKHMIHIYLFIWLSFQIRNDSENQET